jgi:hypothetical protein
MPKPKLSPASHEREKAEALVRGMPICLTGARSGDTLRGFDCVAKDAMVELTDSSEILPQRKIVDAVRAYPDLWSIFLTKLGAIQFYETMSIAGREQWLLENNVVPDQDLAEAGAHVRVLQLGTNPKGCNSCLNNLCFILFNHVSYYHHRKAIIRYVVC